MCDSVVINYYKRDMKFLSEVLNKRSRKLLEERRTKSIQMKYQKRQRNKNLKARIRRLKVEMEEISADQKGIREGQTQVRQKFKEIESECAQLRKESNLISQQSADTQMRLDLMFKILKARQDKDFDKANNLTQSLRDLIAKQNEKKQSNDKDVHPRLNSKGGILCKSYQSNLSLLESHREEA